MGKRYIQVGGVVVEVTLKGAHDDTCESEIDRVFDGFLKEAGDADYRIALHSLKNRHSTERIASWDRREIKQVLKTLKRRFPFTGLPCYNEPMAGTKGHMPAPGAESLGSVSPDAIQNGRVSLVATPSFLMAVDHEGRTADAILLDDEHESSHSAAALAVEALYGVMLPEYGGMILHAAAISVEERGVLLVGGADTGKTTVSSRVPKERLLADDGAVCIRRNGRIALVPSPFTQTPVDTTAARSVGLASLLFLFQDKADYTEPISPGEAMVSLLSNHIHFFRFMSHQNARLTFLLIERIINDVPIERLHFSLGFDPTDFFMERTYVR